VEKEAGEKQQQDKGEKFNGVYEFHGLTVSMLGLKCGLSIFELSKMPFDQGCHLSVVIPQEMIQTVQAQSHTFCLERHFVLESLLPGTVQGDIDVPQDSCYTVIGAAGIVMGKARTSVGRSFFK